MENFSLFFPPDHSAATAELHSSAWHDLGMEAIAAAFTPNRDHQEDVREVLACLIHDPEVIRYRQDILSDLLDSPALAERLAALLPVIDSLAGYAIHSHPGLNSLYEVSWRLGELQSTIDCIESLYLALDITRILRRIGGRALYSTHLHELAARTAELNASEPGDSPIISVVSSAVEPELPAAPAQAQRTYRIEIRPPLGQSYAREIAARYGISYAQLEKGLADRGVIS